MAAVSGAVTVLAALAFAISGALAGARRVQGEVVDQVRQRRFLHRHQRRRRAPARACTCASSPAGTGYCARATGYLQERPHLAGTEGRGVYAGEVSR